MKNDPEPHYTLKPCPFCGKPGRLGVITSGENMGGEFIQCTSTLCAASTMLAFPAKSGVKTILIDAWNSRASADDEIADIEDALHEYEGSEDSIASVIRGILAERSLLFDALKALVDNIDENDEVFPPDLGAARMALERCERDTPAE